MEPPSQAEKPSRAPPPHVTQIRRAPAHQQDHSTGIAAGNGHLEVVMWLVEQGHANVNQPREGGWTALHSAANNGHLEVVKWLVEKGHADADQATKNGLTPLSIADSRGHTVVKKFLAELPSS